MDTNIHIQDLIRYHLSQVETLTKWLSSPTTTAASVPGDIEPPTPPAPVASARPSRPAPPAAPKAAPPSKAPVDPQVALVNQFKAALPREFSDASLAILAAVARKKPASSAKAQCESPQSYGSALGRLLQLEFLYETEQDDMYELNEEALRARIA